MQTTPAAAPLHHSSLVRRTALRRALLRLALGLTLLTCLLATAAGWTVLAASPHAAAAIADRHPWAQVIEEIHNHRP